MRGSGQRVRMHGASGYHPARSQGSVARQVEAAGGDWLACVCRGLKAGELTGKIRWTVRRNDPFSRLALGRVSRIGRPNES